MWLYIVLVLVALLMGVFSVMGFYLYFDGFYLRKLLKEKPRAPLSWLAMFSVIYYVFLWALFIWR